MKLNTLSGKHRAQFLALQKQASSLMRTQNYQAAINVYEQIYALTKDPRSLQIQGVCCYHLGDFAKAIELSKKALDCFAKLGIEDIETLVNLTEIHGVNGDIEESKHYGAQCLLAKHKNAVTSPFHHNAQSNASHGDKKVFSFSLFGAAPKYCENAIRNVERIEHLFPGFIGRFYVDASVPDQVKQRLITAGAEVIPTPEKFTKVPGTLWRFLALDDQSTEVVICRDCDSVVSEREVPLINEWLESPFQAHVIRDFPSHCELILAGLFGLKTGTVSSVGDAMLSYVENRPTTRYMDQYFLRDFLWPQIYQTTLTHDRSFHFGENLGVTELPAPQSSTEHIGANAASKSIRMATKHPDDTLIEVRFVAAREKSVIGPYTTTVKNGLWNMAIPDHILEDAKTGKLEIKWQLAKLS